MSGGQLELLTRRMKIQKGLGHAKEPDQSSESGCTCKCLPYQRAYREDLGICVDDIHGRLIFHCNIIKTFSIYTPTKCDLITA